MFPKKTDAARHRRSKADVAIWNQFTAAHQGRNVTNQDFRDHPHTHPAYEGSIHPLTHPAHSTNIRRLVTYPSKNNLTKASCRYGTYKDGSVVKCLRSPHHAPPGASHKRGAHTGDPIGRPREHTRPNEEENEDEIEAHINPERARKRNRAPPPGARHPFVVQRRSARLQGGLNSKAPAPSTTEPRRSIRRKRGA